ncbi:hypothetical protein LL127_01895 [Clostridium estertheticum]|uniref:hypothetical protein n=1 Tax=Clostridium estertheticum TaxID=238834 RepID=UPI001CF599B6|nr:hypothetical protein [Clostridium estertheticum]MCB2308911.1 hypothetical protein [Clostridium estertheticum]MCB2347348.1 hypothetical protein [Clostridium estertheticum]WAG46336.1 hypothetical protein LL127_01895 [Clostridium estertheticum]
MQLVVSCFIIKTFAKYSGKSSYGDQMNVIFAGTNGDGKTLMYKSIYYNENKD